MSNYFVRVIASWWWSGFELAFIIATRYIARLAYSSIPNCRVPRIVAYPCLFLTCLFISYLFLFDYMIVSYVFLFRSTVCGRITYACKHAP
jgi:hypothetical protein